MTVIGLKITKKIFVGEFNAINISLNKKNIIIFITDFHFLIFLKLKNKGKHFYCSKFFVIFIKTLPRHGTTPALRLKNLVFRPRNSLQIKNICIRIG